MTRVCRAAVVALLLLLCASSAEAQQRKVIFWHSYRGGEEIALARVLEQFAKAHPDITVEALAIPFDSYASKLTTATPRGNGPDVFVFAHERIGGWADAGVISALDSSLAPGELDAFIPQTLEPLRYQDKIYALPLAFKTLALFVNRDLVPRPPTTTDEMVAIARRHSSGDTYGLAYRHEGFFFHSPWYFGFGGELFVGDDPRPRFDSPGAIASYDFVKALQTERLLPEEPTDAVITQLFNEGRAAMVVNGPWFVGQIADGINYDIVPLPIVSATGKPARPFLTDEAVFVAGPARDREAALTLARYVAGPQSALLRATVGRQVVAHKATWDNPAVAGDPVLTKFRAAADSSTPTDNRPRMRMVWEPGDLVLRKLLRRGDDAKAAATAGLRRYDATARQLPPSKSPWPYLIVIGLFVAIGLSMLIRWSLAIRRSGLGGPTARGFAWISPALITSGVLLFVPFAVGLALSLFAHRSGDWSFVGVANFWDILSGQSYSPLEPLSFYFALLVTVLWTAVNVVLHVGLGLFFALLISRKALAMRPLYRVLLILPWAIPNYITALIWKGLFHKQYGAINSMLEVFGAESISWFSSFYTSFMANVCANAWLGFPFMMVVCLGALQSVPQDLYEAADVDGASAWQKFRHITVPLLRPAMLPAILIGTVWTFNQFNIVYLVSGGEPDNSTDILISEAYRWAFTRQEQYGYAAAYAALIFVILLVWSVFSTRTARSAESM